MITKNCVLTKDDVGKAKPTCYDLPDEGFAYGRAEPADLEGAREVTMHWAAHVPRAKPGTDCQDFRKINKLATKVNVTNAKDLATFRKGNDVTLIASVVGYQYAAEYEDALDMNYQKYDAMKSQV